MKFEEICAIQEVMREQYSAEELVDLFRKTLSPGEFRQCSSQIPSPTLEFIDSVLLRLTIFIHLHTVSMEELADAEFPDVDSTLLHVLDLPDDVSERRAYLEGLISPVYEHIRQRFSSDIDRMNDTALSEILRVDGSPSFEQKCEIALSLLFSDNPWKRRLSVFAFKDCLDIEVVFKVYEDLNEELIVLRTEYREALDDKKSVERAISRKNEQVKDLEQRLHAAESDIADLQAALEVKPEINMDEETQKYVDELTKEYEEENRDLKHQLATLEAKYGFVHDRFKRLRRSLKAQYTKPPVVEDDKPFGGIKVYAAADFIDRYLEVFTYQDSQMGVDTFTEVIDQVINHICERVRDGGTSVIKTEFDWMSSCGLHFYKHNGPPGKWSRPFFLSDWNSELTVYDFITPAEHQEHVSSHGGRYKALHDGVSFDLSNMHRIRIYRSFSELLDD